MASIPKNLINANQENSSEFWNKVIDFLEEFNYNYNYEKTGILQKYSITDKEYWRYSSILSNVANTICNSITGYGMGSDFWEDVRYDNAQAAQAKNPELFARYEALSDEYKEDCDEVKTVYGEYVRDKIKEKNAFPIHERADKDLKEILAFWFNYNGPLDDFYNHPRIHGIVYTHAVLYHG